MAGVGFIPSCESSLLKGHLGGAPPAGPPKQRGLVDFHARRLHSKCMSTMNAEMYDALIAAGAPEDKARAAAVSMSEDSLATKGDIHRVEKELVRIEKELTVIKWMLALVIAATVLPLVRQFF